MKKRIAINGFGRIGRLAFRMLHDYDDIEIVAINDLVSLNTLVYLLKYDSTQGIYDRNIEFAENKIIVDDKETKIFTISDAAEFPWKELDIDLVLECTGFYISKEKAMAHINAGAKRVLISAPAGNDIPTIVFNTNHDTLTADDVIISAASCTTNCLAPMAKALNDFAKIESGIMTTIHAYTGDQMILDAPQRKENKRRSRAGAINIVPSSTGAAKAIGFVVPELDGKLIGNAQRVPVATGSIVLLNALVDKKVTVKEINAAMRAAINDSFGYTDEEIVSSDIIGMKYASLFDATQTCVTSVDNDKSLVQVAAWYDNEASFTNNMCKTVLHILSL